MKVWQLKQLLMRVSWVSAVAREEFLSENCASPNKLKMVLNWCFISFQWPYLAERTFLRSSNRGEINVQN